MLRRLIACAVGFAALAVAGIWPEQWGVHKRTKLEQLKPSDPEVWQEYGLEAAERAEYPGFRATGYRLGDSTAALAIFQWLRPAGKASDLEENAVIAGSRAFLRRGNYILDIEGRLPEREDLDLLYLQIPRLDHSAIPALPGYLPKDGLVAGSERYVIGPATLAKFYPGIAPSLAAFSLGAEAQVGRFQTPNGELALAIFSYPTPQIARDKAAEFQKAATAKRTGPMVAVILNPPNADEAEKLLAKVNYKAAVIWNEGTPKPELNPGDLLIGIFVLCGVLILFAVLGGAGFAGIRMAIRRLMGKKTEEEAMLTLHLEDK
ncbi:MAG: hypothetical protein R2729_12440 [Bryobacteraceae bacterium]